MFCSKIHLRPATLLKKRLWQTCNFIKKEALAKVFSCEFWEISKNTFSAEHLQTTASFSRKISEVGVRQCPEILSKILRKRVLNNAQICHKKKLNHEYCPIIFARLLRTTIRSVSVSRFFWSFDKNLCRKRRGSKNIYLDERCFTNKLSFYKHKAYKHAEAEIHFKYTQAGLADICPDLETPIKWM